MLTRAKMEATKLMPIDRERPEFHLSWTAQEAKDAVVGNDGYAFHPGGAMDAYWMIKASGGDVLSVLPQVMNDNGTRDGTFYVLLPECGGRWSPMQEKRVELLKEADREILAMAGQRYQQLLMGAGGEKAANAFMRRIRAHLGSPAELRVKHAGVVFHSVRAAMRRYGDADAMRSEICREHELDADMRYLGFDDCIYDLDWGGPVDLASGKAALVTQTVGMGLADLPPSDVNALTPEQAAARADMRALLYRSDVADDLMAYLRGTLAWSIRGKPAQQYTLLIDAGSGGGREGKGNAGKTTLLQAVQYSLGSYGAVIELTAFQHQKAGATSGELAPLVLCRFVWTDEAAGQRMNADRWKRLTGSGRIKWRALYQNFQERDIVAMLFGASNAPLKLDLADDAEKRRYRPVPVPEIAEADRRLDLKDAWKSGTPGSGLRRAALLAELLTTLAGMSGPPEPPQAVLDLADEHQAANDGAMGAWVRAEVSVDDSDQERVSTKAAWLAFCQMTPERERWSDQRQLTGLISRIHNKGCRMLRVDGKSQRGWSGLRLSAEAEEALVTAGGKQQKALQG